jgi:charged multivesicular body protein 2A
MGEIRKMARTGQQGAIRIMAQDLVRTRRYSTKFYRMKAQIQGVSLQLQTMQSTSAMTDSMKGVAGMANLILGCFLKFKY